MRAAIVTPTHSLSAVYSEDLPPPPTHHHRHHHDYHCRASIVTPTHSLSAMYTDLLPLLPSTTTTITTVTMPPQIRPRFLSLLCTWKCIPHLSHTPPPTPLPGNHSYAHVFSLCSLLQSALPPNHSPTTATNTTTIVTPKKCLLCTNSANHPPTTTAITTAMPA